MTQAPTSQISPFAPRIPLMPSQPISYNAVKIEINDPTVNTPAAGNNQGYYYNIPTQSAYDMPTAPMGQLPSQANQVIPQAQTVSAVPVPPQPQPVAAPVVDTTAPTVIEQAPVPTPAPAPVAPQAASPAPAVQETKPAEPQQSQAPQVDVKSINDKLVSQDLEAQKSAIHQIAEIGQNSPEAATQLLTPEVFNNLNGIIEKDTSTLEGPTKEQIELRQKEMSGTKLTPEETAKAEKLSPMEFAEMNKQISIYTTAVLQKVLRAEVDKEAAKNNIQPLSINELPGSESIAKNLKDNPNPIIREACISALTYVAKPDDNAVLVPLLRTVAKEDKDENVKATAQEMIKKLDPENKFAEKVEAAPAEAKKEPEKTEKK